MSININSVFNEVIMYIVIALLVWILVLVIHAGILNYKNKSKNFLLQIVISILIIIYIHDFLIFGLYFYGLKAFSKKNYEQAIKIYTTATKLTFNNKIKSFLHGEIGFLYLLLPQKGFDVIKAYNTAFLYSKSYKLTKNSEVWPKTINLIFYRKESKNISSNWPLLAAKVYTYENHFERAKKIYLTSKDSPIWSELVILSILEYDYDKALKYADTLVIKNNIPESYAKRANIYKLLDNRYSAKLDIEEANILCKNDIHCLNKVKTLSETFIYNAFQDYYYQREWLGFKNTTDSK